MPQVKGYSYTQSLPDPEGTQGTRIYKYPKLRKTSIRTFQSLDKSARHLKNQKNPVVSVSGLIIFLITSIHICLLVFKTSHQTSPWLPQETQTSSKSNKIINAARKAWTFLDVFTSCWKAETHSDPLDASTGWESVTTSRIWASCAAASSVDKRYLLRYNWH